MGNITHFRIDYTDVILQDYEDGKGKIIISNDDRDINLSYYWSCMGQGYNLSKFILQTDNGYLINKLGKRDGDGPINMKKTMAKVRKFIKEETDWVWYISPEGDRELRDELNRIQRQTSCSEEFISSMSNLDLHEYYCYEGEEVFRRMIFSLRSEPWYFIVNDPPLTNVWLSKFLPKLRDYLKKESEVTP